MIAVHVAAPVRFMRAALPGWLERRRRDVVDVSSLGDCLNVVTVEDYGATEAHLVNLTESLHVALMGTGIRVQALMRGLTVTEFRSRLGADSTAEQKRRDAA